MLLFSTILCILAIIFPTLLSKHLLKRVRKSYEKINCLEKLMCLIKMLKVILSKVYAFSI